MANRGRVSVRRPVEWLGYDIAVQAETTSTNSVFEIATPAQLSEYIHPTLVRVRGVLLFNATGNIVDGTTVPLRITLGITIVTAQAAAAASVPVSVVDLDADWLYWDQFGFQNSVEASAATIHEERIIDSKAMRRIAQPDNASIVLVVATTFGGITGNLRYRSTGRLLIKGD